MTVFDLLNDTDLSNDRVRICIKDPSGVPIASGNWYQDQILRYQDEEIKSFYFEIHTNRLSAILAKEAPLW